MSTAPNINESFSSPAPEFNVKKIREDFPILKQNIKGKPLVYLDNAATSQKPSAVIETLNRYYEQDNSNIHRGVHELSERATHLYEESRKKIQKFLGAKSHHEIIFCGGTTAAINLVAQTFGKKHLTQGDEILISHMEHHSTIVPWQMLCEETGAVLKVAPIDEAGDVVLEEYEKLLSKKTKLVSIVHISNSLGTINPVKQLIQLAHSRNIPVMLDGAQAVPHLPVDVQDLDCDFYAFSGHKVFGPTGIGVLYGKEELLEAMPPYQGGGDMIATVTFEKTTYNHLPYKFEAGTPHIAGVIGMGAAVDYLNQLDFTSVNQYEQELLNYAHEKIEPIEGLKIIGRAKKKASVVSFVLDGIHPHDIGTILDQEGIAIRTGHHCTMPLMIRYNIPATARASMAFYNTREEIDALVQAIQKVKEVFA